MKLTPIKKKKEYNYKGSVYDLNVEEDHTYNVNGHIVHNSDYVMLGGQFATMLESPGAKYWKGMRIKNEHTAKWFYNKGFKLYKKYRGMSTIDMQKKISPGILKHPEGISKTVTINNTIEDWVSEFSAALRSTMSYCDCTTLKEFIGKVNYNIVSNASYNSLKK